MAYSRPRPLYGVWIDEALKSNDAGQIRAALEAARAYFAPNKIHVLYGVIIDEAISGGASREELQGLLDQARAAQREDLQGAISKLEAHLGGK
ncbi:MAG TPA: hypothetical protein VFO89_17160 [Thermoanaerobaculia bacterium]|nr:hypothetical protein [Thermoanaerobaculia bacterium]